MKCADIKFHSAKYTLCNNNQMLNKSSVVWKIIQYLLQKNKCL